jgi:hypothetical protein
MIVESIKKLGFRPEGIKVMNNGQAAIDHAGAFAVTPVFGPEPRRRLHDYG